MRDTPTSSDFVLHELEWNRETARRFWDYQGRTSERWSTYFSNQVGDSLLSLVSRHGALRGDVLDFGCGPGFLTEKLLQRGLRCTALDFSADSIATVRQRLGRFKNLADTVLATSLPTDLPDASYDLVFFVETLEHLLPEDVNPTLAELARLTRLGGRLVVTTPHDENLDANKVACPECGAVFHQRQHLTSWTPDSLTDLLEAFGFRVQLATPTNLRPRSLMNPLRSLVSRCRGDKPRHLVCIAHRMR